MPTLENGGLVIDEDAGTMSVTWKMREDINWQDSKPVTADDVIFTWNAIADPENGTWVPGSDYIDSVEQVDQYRSSTSSPVRQFLNSGSGSF